MIYAMPEEPWAVHDDHFHRIRDPSEKLKFLLNYAVMAPSIYNTQPWLFRVTGSEVAMYVDRARALPIADPQGRNLVLSCGAALFNLRIAIRYFGYEPVIRTFPDFDVADLLAFVRLGRPKQATDEEQDLFAAIRERRTVRSRFLSKVVEPDLIQHIQKETGQEGAHLHVIQDDAQQSELLEVIREAHKVRSCDGKFVRERSTWVHAHQTHYAPPRNGGTALLEGVFDSSDVIFRGLDPDQLQTYEEELLGSGPVFVVLSTKGDNLPAWLSAGQALGRLLLTATHAGLNAAFLNHPVGIKHLRDRVAALTGEPLHPQMILRIGYGIPGTPTRRQPVLRVTSDG